MGLRHGRDVSGKKSVGLRALIAFTAHEKRNSRRSSIIARDSCGHSVLPSPLSFKNEGFLSTRFGTFKLFYCNKNGGWIIKIIHLGVMTSLFIFRNNSWCLCIDLGIGKKNDCNASFTPNFPTNIPHKNWSNSKLPTTFEDVHGGRVEVF